MKRISWLMIVPFVLVAVSAPVACVEFQTFTFDPDAGGSGGMGGAGGGSGGMMSSSSSTSSSSSGMGGAGGNAECTKVEDCISSECRIAAGCEDNKCVWTNELEDKVVQSQLYGDCLTRVCDGNGGIKTIPSDPTKDTYDWKNPCYVNSCDAFPTPIPVADMPKTPCMTPWLSSSGYCSNLQCVDCVLDAECASNTCRNGRCIPVECTDGMVNGTETDIDCGGSACLPCVAGKICTAHSDCEGTCDTKGTLTCLAPSCGDGVRNRDETAIDCGGMCAKEAVPVLCDDFAQCLYPGDCKSGVCKSGMCNEATCGDQTQNQGEEKIDCGGPCAPCPKTP